MSWRWAVWMAFGRILLQVLAATSGLMVLLASIERVEWLQMLSLVFYGWPIVLQISALLWAKEVEANTWKTTLHLQGFSSVELYGILLKMSTICSLVYFGFWWFGASSSTSDAAVLFPERHLCEWSTKSCSVPMLIDDGNVAEIAERLLRFVGCLLMPMAICCLFWRRRCAEHWIWMGMVGAFLLQEIVFAWLPLNS